ncbi:serine-arginine protein 55-like [Plodia interpunctella]|uniref:serine-arginine protein 55-like n=1 Tax=Plodia interpunctella TaxID=58824 RepID=UPI0023677A43|nr:serine-arginine protein 55-like [Plodia interpunctella]
MEGYGFPYPQPFAAMATPPEGEYPDHGDGFGDYYGMSVLKDNRDLGRPSRTKHRSRRTFVLDRSRSQSNGSGSQSRSKSRSRSRTRSRSGSRSLSQAKELKFKEPSFLDAFRVLYITPSKSQKSGNRFLATKKRQDRIHELLKSDGLGSKRWLFYPRSQTQTGVTTNPDARPVPGSRDNVDQRIKIDGDFFRKYKRRNKVEEDAPIAKLKRWELILYKKLGFIQAV